MFTQNGAFVRVWPKIPKTLDLWIAMTKRWRKKKGKKEKKSEVIGLHATEVKNHWAKTTTNEQFILTQENCPKTHQHQWHACLWKLVNLISVLLEQIAPRYLYWWCDGFAHASVAGPETSNHRNKISNNKKGKCWSAKCYLTKTIHMLAHAVVLAPHSSN